MDAKLAKKTPWDHLVVPRRGREISLNQINYLIRVESATRMRHPLHTHCC